MSIFFDLVAGSFELLKYLFAKEYESIDERNFTNEIGGNLLHVVCQQTLSQGNKVSFHETAIRLLLNHSISPFVQDNQKKLAVDYLPIDSTLRSILNVAISTTTASKIVTNQATSYSCVKNNHKVSQCNTKEPFSIAENSG